MRKLIVILTTCFILFSLIGCQGNSEEKRIEFSGLEGQGTDENPYQVTILKGETKSLSFSASQGLLDNLKAYEAEKNFHRLFGIA